jgi:hypothetical protein
VAADPAAAPDHIRAITAPQVSPPPAASKEVARRALELATDDAVRNWTQRAVATAAATL